MKTMILIVLAVLATPANDQEIFERANALWDQGRQIEALKACKELIKNYPTSKYVPDAFLMVGEYYFDQAQIEKALMVYKKVTQYKDSKVYSYALYKTGWCYFNIQEFDKALATFVSVVKHETGRQSNLRREALNDTVLAYSHAGSAKSAPAFFKRLAPQEAVPLLEKLAGMYYGSGKLQDAVLMYQHLLSKEQCSAKELVYQKKILDCMVQTGNQVKTIEEAGRLVVMFGQVDKCLLNPTARQLTILQQIKKETEQTMYTLAVSFRKEAEATKDPDTFRHSQKMAGLYLELFSGNPRAGEIRNLIH